MEIAPAIFNVGVEDTQIDLFEGYLPVPDGIKYNSYVIKSDKIAVMDSVDAHFCGEWLNNLQDVLQGAQPDYLVALHMEPDHSACIFEFAKKYPQALIVGNAKTFVMLSEFFGCDFADRRVVVKDGDKLSLGKHELTFIFAPMVHWPEVMTAYESSTQTYFSADAFGTFGVGDGAEDWATEARRYYYAIVGKFGAQVQSLLKKVSAYQIKTICSLHGPVLGGDLSRYLQLYDAWSSYRPEKEGVFIAYTSVYGHTKAAAEALAQRLNALGVETKLCDVARTDHSVALTNAFIYSKTVFATTTYNGGIFPAMRNFIYALTSRNFSNRTVAFVENGSWAPVAAKAMLDMFAASKNITFAAQSPKIRSALNADSLAQIDALAEELSR